MTDNRFSNPLLDDDDDEATTVLAGSPVIHNRSSTPLVSKPKFGEKGFGKGKPKNQKGTPRARATTQDAPILAHLGAFQIADAATLSLVTRTKPSNVSKGGDIPTVGGTIKRLAKLKKLGLVESIRSRDDLVTLYGVTEAGIITAQKFGYLLDESTANWSSIREMKRRTVRHHRLISLVAAQFAAGYFKTPFGIDAVHPDQLINEGYIQRVFQPFKERLQAQKKDGSGLGLFAPVRTVILNKAFEEMKARTLAPEDLLEKYPVLYTVSASGKSGVDVKFPDLAVNLDKGRVSTRSRNIAIEIELSRKPWEAVEAILRTVDMETKTGRVYDKFYLGYIDRKIEMLYQKVAKSAGLSLIEDGRFVFFEITDRFGEPVSFPETLGDFA